MMIIGVSHLQRFIASFFFNDTATTEIYTLSLHDALPISDRRGAQRGRVAHTPRRHARRGWRDVEEYRSEEHTSELQSHSDLVCRLLLEKKKRIGKGTEILA